MARVCTVRFLSAVRAMAARCKLPFALRPDLSHEDLMRTKGITKERKEKRAWPSKEKQKKDTAYTVPADAMKSGVGRNSGVPPPSGFIAPAPCSSSHSRTSSSETALTASSSSTGTRLPTSVAARKSSTARLHASNPDPGPPLQGVPRVEAATEGPVGGGEEGDREVEGPVEGEGPAGRREGAVHMQSPEPSISW